jgi:hypothetical protein
MDLAALMEVVGDKIQISLEELMHQVIIIRLGLFLVNQMTQIKY